MKTTDPQPGEQPLKAWVHERAIEGNVTEDTIRSRLGRSSTYYFPGWKFRHANKRVVYARRVQ